MDFAVTELLTMPRSSRCLLRRLTTLWTTLRTPRVPTIGGTECLRLEKSSTASTSLSAIRTTL